MSPILLQLRHFPIPDSYLLIMGEGCQLLEMNRTKTLLLWCCQWPYVIVSHYSGDLLNCSHFCFTCSGVLFLLSFHTPIHHHMELHHQADTPYLLSHCLFLETAFQFVFHLSCVVIYSGSFPKWILILLNSVEKKIPLSFKTLLKGLYSSLLSSEQSLEHNHDRGAALGFPSVLRNSPQKCLVFFVPILTLSLYS